MKSRPLISLSRSARTGARYDGRVVRAAERALARARAPKGAALDIRLVGTFEMRRLNRSYRKKDYATDVLAFPNPSGGPYLGDIAICTVVARRQAAQAGHTLGRELEMLAIHGTLHLLGYDHETGEREARRMFRLQDAILESL